MSAALSNSAPGEKTKELTASVMRLVLSRGHRSGHALKRSTRMQAGSLAPANSRSAICGKGDGWRSASAGRAVRWFARRGQARSKKSIRVWPRSHTCAWPSPTLRTIAN